MNISIEEIVEVVTKEVIKELSRQGFRLEQSLAAKTESVVKTGKIQPLVNSESLEVNMEGFKTPILSVNSFDNIAPEINELLVPEKTIITPGAREIIRRKNIKISYKPNKN